MLDFLKKKNFQNQELQISNPACVDIPSAQEMLENTKKNWPIVDPVEVLNKIKARSNSGERDVSFYNAILSKESIALFEKKGYKVKTDIWDEIPYFNISW